MSSVRCGLQQCTPLMLSRNIFRYHGVFSLTRHARQLHSKMPVFSGTIHSDSESTNGFDSTNISAAQIVKMCDQRPLPLLTSHICKFPGQTFPIELSESRYKVMIASVIGAEPPSELNELQEGLFGLVCKHPHDTLEESIGETDWRSYNVGTIVKVDDMIQIDHEDLQLTCTALHLAQFENPERSLLGYWVANTTTLSIDSTKFEGRSTYTEAADEAKQAYSDFLKLDDHLNDDEKKTILDTMEECGSDCVKLSDWLGARLPVPAHVKQPMLESTDPMFRYRDVHGKLNDCVGSRYTAARSESDVL
eukprot:m.717102 g.717102  ORF g.717102 m.717102 type:complete len:306 (-) comp22985_c0_seq6:4624-5541(-)